MIRALLASATMLWPALAHAECFGSSVTVHETIRRAERVNDIPLTIGGPYLMVPIYKLQIFDLVPGDVIEVTSQVEVTNDLGYNVMFSHFLARGAVDDWRFIAPAYPAGENVTPDMHHAHRTLRGVFVADSEVERVWLVGYAASTRYQDGDAIQAMRGYGGIVAKVQRCVYVE